MLGVCLMSALYLGLMSQQAALSHQLKQATHEYAVLTRIRQEKLGELSMKTLPQRLDAIARQQGFREPDRVLYVNSPAPATVPAAERTSTHAGPGTPAATTDWWEALTLRSSP
jgi:hypothetical protein